jgi:hypothetical protein
MSKIGADDFIVGTNASRSDLEGLPRAGILPPLIPLVDIERTEYVGRLVQTDLVIAGIGETFHVPRAWHVNCRKADCPGSQRSIDLRERKELLRLCRMSDDQVRGFMRRVAGCKHRPVVRVTGMATITELLTFPVASPTVDESTRDYREKIVVLLGAPLQSNIRYRATGEVIAEPRGQRASLLITDLDRLQSAAERFTLLPAVRDGFRVLQIPRSADRSVDAAWDHVRGLTRDLTRHITKIYGPHRELLLLLALLTLHSAAVIPWSGEPIKGVLDVLCIGDTGQGKTTLIRRLMAAVKLGHFTSGSTASRAGVLYSLDSKVHDQRILRWGAFPLAHGEFLALDESQNVPREEWREFTTARSEGVLRVERSIRAEHPSRVRLFCLANPTARHSMAEFQYGIMAVHPAQGFLDPQDLRRFDVVICVAKGDQDIDTVMAAPPADSSEPLIPPDLLRESILWAWTRQLHHLHYAPNAERAIRQIAGVLNEVYGTAEIPLLITDAHEKVARLAVAFAALLHSTNAAHEQIIVMPMHVWLVGQLLSTLYTHPNCAFAQYARVLQQRSGLTEREYDILTAEILSRGSNREDLSATESLLDLFLTEDDIPRADLEAATGLGKDALTRRLAKLRKHRLILSGRRGYRKTARFVDFLRQWSAERAKPP